MHQVQTKFVVRTPQSHLQGATTDREPEAADVSLEKEGQEHYDFSFQHNDDDKVKTIEAIMQDAIQSPIPDSSYKGS